MQSLRTGVVRGSRCSLANAGRRAVSRRSLFTEVENVKDQNEVDQKNLYPKPGTYVPSDTRPTVATGRPMPLNVEMNQYAPFKHPITHGDHVCSLQVRSFFTPDLEFYCNFILRVAFYLQIPVKGVTPLPRRTERWTVIKSPFVHAKTKENFERRTHKRLIKLYDANPETVQLFLATVRKYCISGVGMKAEVYNHEDVNVVERMEDVESLSGELSALSANPEVAEAVKKILEDPSFKALADEQKKN